VKDVEDGTKVDMLVFSGGKLSEEGQHIRGTKPYGSAWIIWDSSRGPVPVATGQKVSVRLSWTSREIVMISYISEIKLWRKAPDGLAEVAVATEDDPNQFGLLLLKPTGMQRSSGIVHWFPRLGVFLFGHGAESAGVESGCLPFDNSGIGIRNVPGLKILPGREDWRSARDSEIEVPNAQTTEGETTEGVALNRRNAEEVASEEAGFYYVACKEVERIDNLDIVRLELLNKWDYFSGLKPMDSQVISRPLDRTYGQATNPEYTRWEWREGTVVWRLPGTKEVAHKGWLYFDRDSAPDPIQSGDEGWTYFDPSSSQPQPLTHIRKNNRSYPEPISWSHFLEGSDYDGTVTTVKDAEGGAKRSICSFSREPRSQRRGAVYEGRSHTDRRR
jgi:hypothetical protein